MCEAGADPAQPDKDGQAAHQYLEQYLDQRLNELIKSPSLRNKRLVVGLADFFHAQERLDHFSAHIRQQIETLQQIPQPNLLHQLALAILSDILQDI